jgi:hypothetical protein
MGRGGREGELLTARRVGVRFVKLERYAANEVAEVVCAPDDIRVLCGRGAAHRDGPTMGVLTRGMGFAFFGGQNDGGVSIYEGPVDRESLKPKNRVRGDAVSRRWQQDTLTRTRSADISYPYAGPRRPVYPSGIPRRELPPCWSPRHCRGCFGLHFLHRRPTHKSQTNARRAHLQFRRLRFWPRAYVRTYHPAGKNLVLERQKEYQVRVGFVSSIPLVCIHWICLLQHSHKPIYYRPPRSRLYLGAHRVSFRGNRRILTAMSGLYKTGFTLGVFGIAYSAYSLIKVCKLFMKMSLYPLRTFLTLQGKN